MRHRLWLQTLAVVAWVTGLTYFVARQHYSLPAPHDTDVNPQTGEAQFNEKNAVQLVDDLSSGKLGIHYRIVGTSELVAAEDHLLAKLYQLKEALDASPELSQMLEMEIWHQLGDGAHLFDFMGKQVWKQYFQLTNIVVRLSSRQLPDSKKDAILVNAHLDSTLPSPGAADDLAGVSVMVEALRVMSSTPTPLHHAAVFLFNGGEESLQDASHLYITKHQDTKDTVRAVINLEAAGTGGREIVFQATSDAMVEAYSHVPHPYGTVLASEIFKTGIIVSDTDFRQFQQYGNLTGLDMALVENSYLYHTTKDTVDRLQPGSLTNMGENLIALLRETTGPDSPLRDIEPFLSTVYFSILGRYFIRYPAAKATLWYSAHLVIFVSYLMRFEKRNQWSSRLVALAGVPLTFIAAIASANLVALFMTLCNRSMSWYRYEFFCVMLFAPPAMVGILSTQYVVAKLHKSYGFVAWELENATFSAVALFFSVVALVGHALGVFASYLFILAAGSMTIALLFNDAFFAVNPWRVGFATYLVASVVPTVVGAEGFMGFLEIFVPLGGRSGWEAPFDHILASLVAGLTFLSAPWSLSFAHRYGQSGLARLMAVFAAISLVSVGFFLQNAPFDADHPKRLLALHMTNISTSPPDFSLHVAAIDGGPGMESLVAQTAEAMSIDSSELQRNVIDDDIPDWDIIYPVSQFLLSYKVPLPAPSADVKTPFGDTFKVTLSQSSLNPIKRQRSLKLRVQHPGIIWSVIGFSGDVVEWSLPEQPERGNIRHHVKEASRYGRNQWELDLTLQLSEEEFEAAQRQAQRRKGQRSSADAEQVARDSALGDLRIDFSGLQEKGIWEAKQATYDVGTIPGMEFFTKMKSVMRDDVDSMMLTAVAGVAHI